MHERRWVTVARLCRHFVTPAEAAWLCAASFAESACTDHGAGLSVRELCEKRLQRLVYCHQMSGTVSDERLCSEICYYLQVHASACERVFLTIL